MHRCRRERRKTVFISKINLCTGIHEPSRRSPILLRRCNQQRRAPLRIAPVWIDVLDQAQVDQRIALNRDGPNQFLGRDGDTRRRLGANGDRPKQYQKYDACPKDESPLKRAHKKGWAEKYTSFVKECSTSATKLRAGL